MPLVSSKDTAKEKKPKSQEPKYKRVYEVQRVYEVVKDDDKATTEGASSIVTTDTSTHTAANVPINKTTSDEAGAAKKEDGSSKKAALSQRKKEESDYDNYDHDGDDDNDDNMYKDMEQKEDENKTLTSTKTNSNSNSNSESKTTNKKAATKIIYHRYHKSHPLRFVYVLKTGDRFRKKPSPDKTDEEIRNDCRSYLLDICRKPCFNRHGARDVKCDCLGQILAQKCTASTGTGEDGDEEDKKSSTKKQPKGRENLKKKRKRDEKESQIQTTMERDDNDDDNDNHNVNPKDSSSSNTNSTQLSRTAEQTLNATITFMIHFARMPKEVRQTMLKEWFRTASIMKPMRPKGHKKQIYTLPIAVPPPSTQLFFCKHALASILDVGSMQWKNLEKSAQNDLPGPLQHGLVGRISNRKACPQFEKCEEGMVSFFKDLYRTGTDSSRGGFVLVNDHDHLDDDLEGENEEDGKNGKKINAKSRKPAVVLPAHYTSKRHVYKAFCWERGWVAKADKNGKYPPLKEYEKRTDVQAPPEVLPVCSWTSFRDYWVAKYPKLVVDGENQGLGMGERRVIAKAAAQKSDIIAAAIGPGTNATQADRELYEIYMRTAKFANETVDVFPRQTGYKRRTKKEMMEARMASRPAYMSKIIHDAEVLDNLHDTVIADVPSTTTKRRRGRPRKVPDKDITTTTTTTTIVTPRLHNTPPKLLRSPTIQRHEPKHTQIDNQTIDIHHLQHNHDVVPHGTEMLSPQLPPLPAPQLVHNDQEATPTNMTMGTTNPLRNQYPHHAGTVEHHAGTTTATHTHMNNSPAPMAVFNHHHHHSHHTENSHLQGYELHQTSAPYHYQNPNDDRTTGASVTSNAGTYNYLNV